MTPVMTTPDTVRLTALVRGRVQGVGFRAFVRRSALDLKISGYAENLPDGRVEVVAEGERSELEHLLVLLRKGPPHAEVTDIDVTWGAGGAMPRGFYVYG
jgi:acylphosphatase